MKIKIIIFTVLTYLPFYTFPQCEPNLINEVNGSPFASGDNVTADAVFVPPLGGFVVTSNNSGPSISVLSVSADGTLTLVGTPTTTVNAGRICVHPSGKFVSIVTGANNELQIFSLDSNGGLTQVGAVINPPGAVTADCAYSSNGEFLAVGADDTVVVYQVNQSTGAVTQIFQTAAIGSGVTIRVTYNEAGTLLAIAAANDGIYMLQVASDGTLTLVPGGPFGPADDPDGLAFTPDGNFLLATYVNAPFTDELHIFSVASNGTLTDTGNTVTTGSRPFDVQVSPNGEFVANSNADDDTIDVYTINSSGVLTKVANALPTGVNPIGLSFSPHNTLLAVGNADTPGTVSVFCIQQAFVSKCAEAIFEKYSKLCV